MFEQIKQEGLFAELLRCRGGRPFLDVNGDFAWPNALTIAGVDAPPVLYLNGYDYAQLGCLAYFSVDILFLIQPIVSSKAVEECAIDIRNGNTFQTPVIAHDRTKDVYHINDGHNRLMGTHRAGRTHLLCKILYKDPLPASHWTIGGVRIVPHEEYVEMARRGREESRLSSVHGIMLS